MVVTVDTSRTTLRRVPGGSRLQDNRPTLRPIRWARYGIRRRHGGDTLKCKRLLRSPTESGFYRAGTLTLQGSCWRFSRNE